MTIRVGLHRYWLQKRVTGPRTETSARSLLDVRRTCFRPYLPLMYMSKYIYVRSVY